MNEILEIAVRRGLITPEQAASHAGLRTPDDLVSSGLIRVEDLPRLLGEHRIGRYRILGELGRGGMGVVYRAADSVLNREVALKVVRADSTPEEHERFLREARAAAALRHPRIVPVHDVGDESGTPFLVMELVQGENFQQAIERNSLTLRERVEVVRQAAEGVAFAHRNGVIHRDIKPGNILVTPKKEAVIMDFGLAKMDEADPRALSVPGVTLGTPAYMAPEQARGEWSEVDSRSDVYSLAATLYHALTGEPPFSGHSIAEVLQRVLVRDPVPPRLLDPAVAKDLETICLKGLDKVKSRRFQSAKDFADELGRFLAGEPILSVPPSMLSVLLKRLRRNRVRVAAGVVAAAGVVLAAASFFWPGKIRLDTDPPGAEIWIDGRDSGRRTPAVLTVWPPGRRKVSLRLDGFEREETDVQVSSRNESRVHRPLVPDHGFATVTSVPSGAEVVAAGRSLGFTPLADARIPKGAGVLEVSLAGYQRHRAEFRVSPGERIRVHAELSPAVGTVDFRAEREATLRLESGDGSTETKLPSPPILLRVGEYRYHAFADNLLPARGSFVVSEGESSTIRIELPPLVRWSSPSERPQFGGTLDVEGDGQLDYVLYDLADHSIAAVRGKDGTVAWTCHPKQTLLNLRLCPDADGDGVADLLLPSSGVIACLSGKTGLTIWEMPHSADIMAPFACGPAGELLIWKKSTIELVSIRGPRTIWTRAWTGTGLYSNCGAGDLDGDGTGDVLAARVGTLTALSGRTGEPIWEQPSYGIWAGSIGDANGDGAPDLAIFPTDEANAHRRDSTLRLISGKDGAQLWIVESVRLVNRRARDIDSDGIGDFMISLHEKHALRAVSGRTGATLWQRPFQESLAWPGFAGDVDGDGTLDAVVTSGVVRLHVLSGRTGRELGVFEPGGDVRQPVAVPDLDGDGLPDLVIGSWMADGALWAVRGRDARLVWRFLPGGNNDWSIPADVDRHRLLVLGESGLHSLRLK